MCSLLEILYAIDKQSLVVVAGDIGEKPGPGSFIVPHFTKDSTIGAGQALDCIS